MVEYLPREFKSALNQFKYPDSWFWARYSMNPYNGCQFGCIYCDARSNKYHIHDDVEGEFAKSIIVKSNLPQLLEKQIKNKKEKDVVAIGGTTDPYQPAEKKFEITKQCLEVFLKYGWPVNLTTKSTLITRDIDLLDQLNQKSWASVSTTLTTLDPQKSRFLEKVAPAPAKRIESMRILKENSSIQVGITFMPIIPYLADDERNLEEVIKTASEFNLDYVMWGGGMTLRDSQAVWFFDHLEQSYPELIPGYEKIYGFTHTKGEYHGSYGPSSSYLHPIHQKIHQLCEEYGVSQRMKRYIPEDYRKGNYQITERMLNLAYEKQSTGGSSKNMFWVAQQVQNLKEPVHQLYRRDPSLASLGSIYSPTRKILLELMGEFPAYSIQSQLDEFF